MNDKYIKAFRGGKPTPMILANGDKYDSRFMVYENKVGHDPFVFIDGFENCNTDPSLNYEGKSGILQEGLYAFICTVSPKRGKYLILFIKEYFDMVNKDSDITDDMLKLPSLIKNPNQHNNYLMTDILVHKGGTSEWDWSAGCMTIEGDDWGRFIDLFKVYEKGYFDLIRSIEWIAPKTYRE